jgi:hypothetical protein
VPLVPGEIFDNLADAVDEWNAQPAGTVGVIAILDSRTYDDDLTGAHKVVVPEGSELLVTAADWPERVVGGVPGRIVGEWVPQGRRPHLDANVSIGGTAPDASDVPGRFALEGVLVEGAVTVLAGNLGGVRLSDCTLVPPGSGLGVNSSAAPGQRNAGLEVVVERSIVGGIDLPDAVPDLSLIDSVVQASQAVEAEGATARIQRCTILGTCAVHTLRADDTIFDGVVTAVRRQVGCVRFCFVPFDPAVRVPRRYRCQPDLALRDVTDPVEQDAIVSRLVPSFTSVAYGDPAYAQLGRACPDEIAAGAEDGAEMGVFDSLKQPQRLANLRTVVDEYLRFGLEAGPFNVT